MIICTEDSKEIMNTITCIYYINNMLQWKTNQNTHCKLFHVQHIYKVEFKYIQTNNKGDFIISKRRGFLSGVFCQSILNYINLEFSF